MRSRLAPTQPHSSLPSIANRPTGWLLDGPFRSGAADAGIAGRQAALRLLAHQSCPAWPLGRNQRVHQGGLRVDGFQRTINLDMNQRGVREYLI